MTTTVSHISAIINLLKTLFGSDIKGISPIPLKDAADLPYITVQEINFREVQALSGDQGLGSAIIQINCWSHDYEEANNIRVKARRYLNAYYGTTLGVEIQGVEHRNDADIHDGIRELHQCVSRMDVWFSDPLATPRLVTFSDRFQRPDSLTLGGGWKEIESDPRLIQIIGGILHTGGPYTPPLASSSGFAIFNSVISNNQYSELLIHNTVALEHPGPSFGPMCRMSYDGIKLKGYELAIQSNGVHGTRGVALSLYRHDDALVNDTSDIWDYQNVELIVDGDSFRLEAVDSILTVKHNGVVLINIVDTFYPSGFIGMGDTGMQPDFGLEFIGWNGGEL